MTYDGRAVANFILDCCDKRGRPINHTALQKIVYFARLVPCSTEAAAS